jgi:Asp-tRNA(Asn)/Glu-tRNA(Gln) amidotransferase A subunit family amidase
LDSSLTDLLGGPALGIARVVADGELSATEVVELHLERIGELNPRLNAIVTLCEDRARAAADAADHRAREGTKLPPLHGVPFVVKDVIATEGVRSTAGSLLLSDFVPSRSATAVTRLERAGAILLGKSNCPELALDPMTDNRVFGLTLNPLDEQVTVGGSSGGDAAAVASGCAALGLGSDYGGSIRWPAQCTGILGLRPTVGRVPLTGVLPFPSGTDLPTPSSAAILSRLQTFGPLARSAGDLFAAVRVVAGPDGIDPNSAPVPLAGPDTVYMRGLACSWADGEGANDVRPDLVRAVERAAAGLSELGMDVQQGRPPGLEEAAELFGAYRLAEGLPVHAELARGRADDLAETMRSWFAALDSRPVVTVGEIQAIALRRDALRARVLSFMERWPILLLPVSLGPPWRLGSTDFSQRFHNLAPCWAVTLLGLPSLSIPCGRTDEGLPASVQVVGRPFADHEVVAVAAALERELGSWRDP